jgi:DNA-directed RNA polymerase subunit RPC12/RpoP
MEPLKSLNISETPLILNRKDLSKISQEFSNFQELSITKKYYCYNCKKKFSKIYIENTPIECMHCHSPICEEILSSYETDILPPDKYTPYSSNREPEPTILRITNPNNPLVQLITNLINSEYENDEIEHILNYVMNNDENKYGSPPAAKSEINKLKKYVLSEESLNKFGCENSCSVCKEDFVIGNKMMDLPCKHYFHEECLMPWLNQHDSCPICRYELKTDDPDYEKMKILRSENNTNINHNEQRTLVSE